jgi:hypothetical protein
MANDHVAIAKTNIHEFVDTATSLVAPTVADVGIRGESAVK